MRRSCATLLAALGFVASLATGGGVGCVRGPRVPEGAQLIWYGESNFKLPLENVSGGTYYVYEEGSGRTLMAAYAPGGASIHFDGLKTGRKYRVYFIETTLGPATRPAADR